MGPVSNSGELPCSHIPAFRTTILILIHYVILGWGHQIVRAQSLAFPGAVGQGAAAVGGRGGDVYHVTNLLDYASGQSSISGSLRHAISSATGPRTIVFDVGGALELARPLSINRDGLTIAGQTAPGGVTLWGYNTNVTAQDLILRHLRFRTGDFNAATANPDGTPTNPIGGNGNMDLLSQNADVITITNGSNRVILDQVSTAWGMDETLSVTKSRNVTVQHSIIAQSLQDSFHHEGTHGYGTLMAGDVTPAEQAAGTGGFTFYGNLWAHHEQRSPSMGGQTALDPGQSEASRRQGDINLVNNVVYDWANLPTHRAGQGIIRANLVGNYYINGPNSPSNGVVYDDDSRITHIYQENNFRDSDKNGTHNGSEIPYDNFGQGAAFTGLNTIFGSDTINNPTNGSPFNFYCHVQSNVITAPEAYTRVINSVGASLWRDSIDSQLIAELSNRSGSLINSQDDLRVGGVLQGIEDLPTIHRPASFDTDTDGIPNTFELFYGLNPNNPNDRNGTELSPAGYTNLEFYLDALTTGSTDVAPIVAFVNRDTNRITLQNVGLGNIVMSEYRLSSASGELDPAQWISIADNYDVDGNQTVDPMFQWIETSSSLTLLSEMEPNFVGTTLAPGQIINLGQISSGGTIEDIMLEVFLDSGSMLLPAIYQNAGADSADFDGDGDVDGSDFLIWQRGLGTGTTFAEGDSDADGDVDHHDLATWQAQYGTSGPPLTASTAVPEPQSPLLIGIAIITSLTNREQSYRNCGKCIPSPCKCSRTDETSP